MTGIQRIEAERKRQIESEGWSATNDDAHINGELRDAAQAYEYNDEEIWPWTLEWFKPGTYARNLEKAGALWLAEADRAERLGDPSAAGGAEQEAKRIGKLIDDNAERFIRTSVLIESTPSNQWGVVLTHGPLQTGRLFDSLDEAFVCIKERVLEFRAVDNFATKLDELPEFIDLAEQDKTETELGKETYVFGPGFGVQESKEEEPGRAWGLGCGGQ